MYDEPRLPSWARALATKCPRCGALLAEEPRPALVHRGTEQVLFCTDESGCGWREWRSADRTQAVASLTRAGRTVDEIAAALGCSRRTVFRELQALREREGEVAA